MDRCLAARGYVLGVGIYVRIDRYVCTFGGAPQKYIDTLGRYKLDG